MALACRAIPHLAPHLYTASLGIFHTRRPPRIISFQLPGFTLLFHTPQAWLTMHHHLGACVRLGPGWVCLVKRVQRIYFLDEGQDLSR